MSELEQLSLEISQCPRIGAKNKRFYSKALRNKIIEAASRYDPKEIVKITGIKQSLIATWRNRYSYSKKVKTKIRPIIINELPEKILPTILSSKDHPQQPVIKFTSPQGLKLEISSCSNQDIISIINVFIGNH